MIVNFHLTGGLSVELWGFANDYLEDSGIDCRTCDIGLVINYEKIFLCF